ncbi:hypothetical protein EVAR_100843_1 [Eumeta japonica]|uniref:BESS domain-containing protein n=1 Tax=Eumeta variegata TaxID=151549 RepID=A0A4C2A5F5_EUMVA|nr:hypothetical protein EVAR_100843_1 [Eumeta japonica]
MKSGSSTDDIYEPTLWYCKEMAFLQNQETSSDSHSNKDTQSPIGSLGGESECSTLDNTYTQEETTTVGANEAPSTSYAVPKTETKNLKRKLDDDLMELAAKRIKEKPDEYEYWGLSCAADLKKMEPMQQVFAKNVIAAIIMEGELGLLHRNSVQINTPTVTITPSYTRSTSTPTSYSSTPSPGYFINYSQRQYSELPSEQLPHNQQNMHYFQQNNQQNMNNFQQEDDADNANEDTLSKYIQFNK